MTSFQVELWDWLKKGKNGFSQFDHNQRVTLGTCWLQAWLWWHWSEGPEGFCSLNGPSHFIWPLTACETAAKCCLAGKTFAIDVQLTHKK